MIAAGLAVSREELLAELDEVERKLQLGVIPDGVEVKQPEKLVRLKVMPYLNAQAVYTSDSVGINKPNPKLSLRACANLNLKPSTVMYVGDNPKNDVDPPN